MLRNEIHLRQLCVVSDGYTCDGFVRAAVSVISRNYDRTNRHVFSTEDAYKAQFIQTMGYRSISTSDQTEATRTTDALVGMLHVLQKATDEPGTTVRVLFL